jgi:hypothetical protein
MPAPAHLLAGSERIRAAGGRAGGPPPYGYRHAGGGRLAPVEHEQHVRWLIKHLSAHGLSLQRISNLLAELAVPARSGETRWPTKTLHRIVRDDLDDAGG